MEKNNAYEVKTKNDTFRGFFIGQTNDRADFKVNDYIRSLEVRFIDSVTKVDANELQAKHDAYCADKFKTLMSWGTTE